MYMIQDAWESVSHVDISKRISFVILDPVKELVEV